jgi:acyl-coenzyme A synthetase/AMP-(fatty) acid ligase
MIRFVDTIPKTPAGKVQKPLLREAFLKENASS